MTDIFAIPTETPSELTAGVSWQWKLPDLSADYSPADHSLTFSFVPMNGGTIKSITATNSDGEFLLSQTSAQSGGWDAGVYSFTATMTRTSDGLVATVCSGHLKVKPNPLTSTADTRTQARRTLEAIEATIEGRASKDADAYTIEGRSITRTPVEDLIRLRSLYAGIVRREENGGSGITYRRVGMT